MAGRRFLSAALSQQAVDAYVAQTPNDFRDAYEMLTTREREVLQLAAEGSHSAKIAARLHISQRTVENHRASLMRKLGLKNQSELIRYAVRRGLIALEE